MNIFFLDQNHIKAAKYHCDIHLNSQIKEAAQILCNTLILNGLNSPYKAAQLGNWTTKWVMESKSNWTWLKNLALALEKERLFRFPDRKPHKSAEVIKSLAIPNGLPNKNFTTPKFNIKVRVEDIGCNYIETYRNYYKYKLTILQLKMAKWTNRGTPFFINSTTEIAA